MLGGSVLRSDIGAIKEDSTHEMILLCMTALDTEIDRNRSWGLVAFANGIQAVPR